MEGRLYYINRISEQLVWLTTSIQLSSRNNLSDDSMISEQIIGKLLNLVCGWSLKHTAALTMKYPGADLVDPEACIAVHVTAAAMPSKIQFTVEQFSHYHLDEAFERFIVFLLTTDAVPSKMMHYRVEPWFDGERDIWNIQHLLDRIQELETPQLAEISDYLDNELTTNPQAAPSMPSCLLPPVPPPIGFFVPHCRDQEIEEICTRLHTDRLVLLWGPAGIGKTELAKQLAGQLAPARGAYYLRYFPAEPWQSFLQETILHAEFKDRHFSVRDMNYAERMRILCQEYSGALLIIDDLLCTDRDIEQLRQDPSVRELLAHGIRLLFTTRHPVKTNGYEVKPLKTADQLQVMKQELGAKYTDEQLLALCQAVNGNTVLLLLAASILKRNRGRFTPEQLLASVRNDSPGNISSDSGNQALSQAMRNLIGLSASDDAEYTLLQFAALLPEGGLDAIMFRNCLPRPYKSRLKQLIDQNFLIHKKGVLTVPPFVRDSVLIPQGFHSSHFDTFLDQLWYALDLNQYDSITVEQLAKIFTKAAEILADPKGTHIYRAGKLWAFDGNTPQALQCTLQALDLQEKHDPDNAAALACTHSDAGALYLLQKEPEKALTHLNQAMNLLMSSCPVNDPELAVCYCTVSECYSQLESRSWALAFQKKAVQIFEQTVPADHPNRILARDRLEQLRQV